MANHCHRCGKQIPDGLKGNADYPHVCKRQKAWPLSADPDSGSLSEDEERERSERGR